MLRHIDRRLWVAEQPLIFLGLEVGTRMTVIQLSDDQLLLISPIRFEQDLQVELEQLGTVKFIIAPNLFHHLYLAESQNIYSQAQLIAPPGIEQKQPNLRIDKIFLWNNIDFNSELEYIFFEGFKGFIPPQIVTVNEIVFFHPESKSLILTDTAFNFDRNFPLTTQLAARVLGSYRELRPTWLEKIAIQNPEKVKKSIDKILAWDFKRVIMAHGNIVETNAKEQLTAGYEWFLK